jgi:hypothetical protein
MTDKELIKQQQEKIERIEQLQKGLHKLSMFGLLTVKDVLDGMSPQEAIKKNMTEDDEE